MKNDFKRPVSFFLAVSFTLWQTPAWGMVDEDDLAKDSEIADSAPEAEHVPGELIVKLKEGVDPTALADLNNKYQVASIGKVFSEADSPEKTLKSLEEKLASLSVEHRGWYWWADSKSPEYQEYQARIDREKQDLESQIQAQKEIITHLAQRQKRAPEGAALPSLDQTYLLKAPSETDIPTMVADYQRHPAVQYAEPNYIAKINVFPQTLPNDIYVDSKPGDGEWDTGALFPGQTFSNLWGAEKIHADKAWPISQGDGVVVAVIDR